MNNKDFADKHTVIYGHNMKDGGMFANLHYYEDSVFFEENPYVYIYTEDTIFVYEVFAAYEFPGVHLLMGYNTSTPEKYDELIQAIYDADGFKNNYNEEMREELNADSRIITLSTCISSKPDKRWLVSAMLREEISAKGMTDEEKQGE